MFVVEGGRLMCRRVFILVLFAIVFAARAAAFPGEARSYFKDWLVVCQKSNPVSGEVGSCRANVSVRDKELFPYGDGTVFQFTVQRGPDTDYFIEYYHTLDGNYPGGSLVLQVDNNKPVSLNPIPVVNLATLTAYQTQFLIPDFKAGRWLTLRYVSQSGEPVSFKLSLLGVTASLGFIEAFYQDRSYN